MRKTAALLLGCCVLMAAMAWPALAARKATKRADPLARMQPMRLTIARDASPTCAPDCAEWIAADGDIVDATAGEFRRLLKRLGNRRLPVLINSRGGSVEAGLAIGRLIRANGIDVGVAVTQFEPCSAAAQLCKAGKPVDGARASLKEATALCASSCAFILAGGKRRVASQLSFVGVHQIKAFRTLVKVRRTYRIQTRLIRGRQVEVSRKLVSEKRLSSRTTEADVTDRSYKPIRAFLSEMAIGPVLIDLILATPNERIHWLTPQERQQTSLVTETVSVQELLRAAKPVAAALQNATEPAVALAPAVAAAPVSIARGLVVVSNKRALRLALRYATEQVLIDAALVDLKGRTVAAQPALLTFALPGDAPFIATVAGARANAWQAAVPQPSWCRDLAPRFLDVTYLPAAARGRSKRSQSVRINLTGDAWIAGFARDLCAAPVAANAASAPAIAVSP